MRRLRIASFALVFAAAPFVTSCLYDEEDEDCEPTPFFCDRQRPVDAELTVLVGGGVLQEVRVYSGASHETGRLVWSGSGGGTIRLPVGPYSATATYRTGDKTVIAVDGDDLGYDETETCSGTCYDVRNGTVDLRLEE